MDIELFEDKEKDKDKNPPVNDNTNVEASPFDYDKVKSYKLPWGNVSKESQGTSIPDEQNIFKDDINKSQSERLGTYYGTTDTQKKLAESQSNWAKLGNTLGKVVTQTLGGTLQAFGATYELGDSMVNKVKGEQSDFNNAMMDLGRGIDEWGEKTMPNYRKTPGKSWDMSDFGWWMDGVKNAASTLQFIIPQMAAVKGATMLSKFVKAEQLLTKAGLNANKFTKALQLGAGASMSRNAENMMESYQVHQTTHSQALKDLENDDTFEELKNGDVGKELKDLGKEVTKENIADYIAAQAGWKAYQINSANIIFDAIQLKPLLKGFDPATRKGLLNTSSRVVSAQNKLLNNGVNVSAIRRMGDYINPMISATGRQLTEGVEEMVNYVGTEEGKAEAAHTLGHDTGSFTQRMSKYLKSGDFYEAGFWGTLGGMIYEGSAKGINKLTGQLKGLPSNTDTDNRVNEIEDRVNIIKQASSKIKEVNELEHYTDEDKKNITNQIKSELALDLGVRAAQAGNTNLLIDFIKSPEYKDILEKEGISKEGDVEKATAKTVDDVLKAEKLYTHYYNDLSTKTDNIGLRDHLISKAITYDFLTQKAQERVNNISNELTALKAQDAHIRASTDPNLEQTIQLHSLLLSRTALDQFLHENKDSKDNILSIKGKNEVEKINKEIDKIREFLNKNEADIKGINPDILTKQSQIIFADAVKNINLERIIDTTNISNVQEKEKQLEKAEKQVTNTTEEDWKKKITQEVKDGKHTIESLEKIRLANKYSKKRREFIDSHIKALKDKQTVANRTEEVEKAREAGKEDLSVIDDLPTYEKKDLTGQDIPYQADIDAVIANKDYVQLRGFVGEGNGLHPNTVQYVKNKIQELRENNIASTETNQLNTPTEVGEDKEFELDESKQEGLQASEDTLQKLAEEKEIDLDENLSGLNNGDLAKLLENRVATTFVPLFSSKANIKPFQIENGNIIIKDEYKKTLETLMNKDFKEGVDIEIYWDKDNKFTMDRWKNSIENEAFAIRYNGITVAWLGTKEGIEYEILKLERLGTETALLKANELRLDLVEVMRIRKQLELSDKVFKSKLIRKGNGTVISRGTKTANSLRSITGIFDGIYAISPGYSENDTILQNLDNSDLTIEKPNKLVPYRQGIVYGALLDANGTYIPVPLNVSKVNSVQAKHLRKHIQDLMSAMYNGLATDSTDIKVLKDRISKYIKVDKSKNYNKQVGFRVIPRGEKNKEEEVRFTYYKGKELYTVIIKNNKGNIPYFVHGKNVGDKVEWFTRKGKTKDSIIDSKNIDTQEFLDILQNKYNNINHSFFGKKQFSIENKVYDTYQDYLQKENILQTDVAQVVDSKGNVVSNLFGFNNDFKLVISSEINKEEKSQEENSIKDLYDDLLIKPYEKEINNFTSDLEYRKNYNLFNKVSTIASETLKNILNNPQNDTIREVANFLQSNISKNDLPIRLQSKIQRDIPAVYSTETNTISVSKEFPLSEASLQQTLLHEIIHGLTANQIKSWVQFTPEQVNNEMDIEYLFNNPTELNFRENTPQYIKDFVSEISKIKLIIENKVTNSEGKSIKNLIKENNDTYYGFTNILEFISETMVNPKFRNKVRQYGEVGILEKIYNYITNLLNKYLGTKLNIKETKDLQKSINLIKNFIHESENIPLYSEFSLNLNKKLTDKFDNNFSRNEINEVINLYEGLILKVLNKENIDETDNIDYSIKSRVTTFLNNYVNGEKCPSSLKEKVKQIIDYNYSFFEEAKDRINRQFKISNSYDLSNILEEQELQKEWDDSVVMQVSSQETVTKEIKKFIKTVPELNSTKVSFTKDNTPIWDNSFSSITGLNKFVDFNTIYPYMIRNLIGSRNRADLLNRLDRMSSVYPSFTYIKHELEKNELLLTQFEVNLAHKNKYNSYITLINNIDENNPVIQVINEGKNSEQEKVLANKWNNNINLLIDKTNTAEEKEEVRHNQAKIIHSLSTLKNKFEENKDKIVNNLFDLFNNIGVELSFARLENEVNNARTFQDLKPLLDKEAFIRENILLGKKSNSFGNLNELSKNETLFSFDIVENVVMSIDNKPLYIIRNPNYLSNWFTLAHSESPQDKQEFEQLLRNYAKVPELETSNWLWGNELDNDGKVKNSKLGFIHYQIVDDKKIPVNNIDGTLKTNKDFIKTFNFHNFNGAKETSTNNAQKYHEFNSNDYDFISLVNYLKINDKEKNETKDKYIDYAFYPILIPSDSSSMYFINSPRIKININDINFTENKVSKINRSSALYQGVLNTVRQEIKRIKQTQSEVFDIIDNKLVVKENLDYSKLQQYYHFGKTLIYNEDGTINLEKTFIDQREKIDGKVNPNYLKPIGQAFRFQNMIIEKGNKFITLNDIEGIFINNALIDNTLNKDFQEGVKNFVDDFITQEVEKTIKEFSKHLDIIKDKHNFIANGSNNHLLTEFVLNSFITNVEQFNFFNGGISEYKNKIDTNKRAKQVATPGESLSEEVMRYVRKNGSVNNGRTFTGVTIKDIETTSNTINFIITSVKDRLLVERKGTYDPKDIDNFSYNNLIKKKPSTKLEEDVFKVIKSYLNINAGDAQGYTTLDRYVQIIKGRGQFNSKVEAVIEKIKTNKQLTTSDIQTLKPIKGFYYDRSYDASLNKLVSNQIKYSTFPLIPQMVFNTQLEKLMKVMEEKGIDEAFYESAHKVGAKMIYEITNEDGSMSDEKLKKLNSTVYYNKSWQLQLEVPEHLRDEENLLATQISKLVIANLSNNSIYKLDNQSFTGQEIKDKYFKLLNTNIIESANNLLDDLGITKTDEGFTIKDENIANILNEEINKRGLSDNYKHAIEINEQGQFNLPLFTNNISQKWEAILTSLFTNRIMKQKMPGASAVLASRLFLDNSLEQKDFKTKGVEWIKKKENDKKLKSFSSEDGKTLTVEVLLGAWSSKFFQDEKRVSIDTIPEEIRTMIGYRIPTQAKHSMIVFNVVGFLPEENKQLIITPDDLVSQMGSDFDVDKMFIISQNFRKQGETFELTKFVDTSKLSDEELKKHYNQISGRNSLKAKEKNLKKLEKTVDDKETKKLLDAIFNSDEEDDTEESFDDKELRSTYNAYDKLRNKVENFPSFKEWKELSVEEQNSLQARQNEIFNIYKSILTNPEHFKEIITPAEFNDFVKLKNEINEIFGINDANINPLSIFGQSTFRKRNMDGRNLKGISANLNAFGAIAQHTKMYLNDNLAFKFKFNINNYDAPKLRERYGKDLEIKGDYAYINFSKLGYAPDGSYLNVDGELILEHASQGIGAAVDVVKDPTFEAFNATTYTYPIFHTMLLSGVPTRLAGMFIRQPIIKFLNDYYFENKSLLGDKSGKEIETVKKYYQTQLAKELTKKDVFGDNFKKLNVELIKLQEEKKNEVDEIKRKNLDEKITRISNQLQGNRKVLDKLKKINHTTSRGYFHKSNLVYLKREDTKSILGYDPDNLEIFDVEELKENLINRVNYSKLNSEERITYLRTQLQIIEHFNKYKKAAEGVQDVMQATKTDGIGAGPSLLISNELIKKVDKLGNAGTNKAHRVLIDKEPAITKIYPSYFNKEEESKYPVIETYFNYVNRLSSKILNNLFIQQTLSYQNILDRLESTSSSFINEEQIKNLFKFLNSNLLNDFEEFQDIDKETLLGVNNSDNSLANRVSSLQSKMKDILSKRPQHILNFLKPILDKESVDKNKYHKIDFVFYKNELTDDNLVDSFIEMYNSPNEEEKNIAKYLIKYSYVTNGLSFGFGSFSKVIPNEILVDLGLNDYLRDLHEQAKKGLLFDGNILDLYFRNNWNNSTLVPQVRNRFIFDNGKIKIDSETNEPLTVDNTPNWHDNDGIIQIHKVRWREVSDQIKNAPYILVKTKEGSKLFKKYEAFDTSDINDLSDAFKPIDRVKNTFNDFTYYYQIEKLGKDGIIEKETMFTDNKSEFNENELVAKIEERINKIEERRIAKKLEIDNISQKKIDEQNKKCNG